MKSSWKASGRLLLHALFGSLKFIRSRVFELLRKKDKTRIYVFNNGVLSWMDMQGNMEPILTSPTRQTPPHPQDLP